MAKTVLEGLKASTSNFMAFRLSAKLSEDISMLVNVPRFLKTKFGGLRVKISSRNIACKDRDQICQCLKVFGPADPRRPAWESLGGPRETIRSKISRKLQFWSEFEVHNSSWHLQKLQ
ncbi:hypothetical protein HanXRQr2_Chr11g0516991 [Helianthus annuus]|uniref:Uncharacterized protein n=1 Tax=Helianthus annuus TaxID=4232 RepID=A0A9K3N259_HELAN|nr:hypothetical protein HanXRQr2_Chr11g0516991 [Helianthus annuus]KAJ0511771.1 hypothetical protein HanIR_Chr11g0555801 [Helianthus annuus]KAJ0547191.1 hypothetical protein HanIR_Chr08g0369381 [Helianthus annuus]KAJ0877289.1 hypothetical protein HanPSC8_Chr11g0498361 [Helianthus annuus]